MDNHPGDRAANCGGLMPAIGYTATGGAFTLIHRCQNCGHRKSNKTSPDDDLARLAAL